LPNACLTCWRLQRSASGEPCAEVLAELGGFFQEGRRWLQRALEGSQALVSIPRVQALLAAAELSSAISDFDYGLQCARQAQQLFQQLGERRQEIDARLMYCDLARYAGKLAHLQTQIEEALQMAEHMSYTAGMAKGKQFLAIHIVYTTGEIEAAIQYELLSVALWRELERPFELATALSLLGVDLLEIHEYAAAQQALKECRDIYRSLGYQRGVALAIHSLGETAQEMGDYARARALFCDALRIRHHLACGAAMPTHLNSSPRSTKLKNATNERFNSGRQPTPCGFALERHSSK